MKIFNWMRRRFNDEKRDKSVENVKHDNNENDNHNHKQSLMNDDEFDHDQWRGGLLTIGTFGMGPHKHYLMNQTNEYCPNYYHMVEEHYEVKEEEIINDEIPKSEGEIMMSEYVAHINDFCDDQSAALIKITKMDGRDDAATIIDHHEIMVEKKDRITLADLFNAESAEMEEIIKPPCNLSLKKKKATATPPDKLPEQLKKKRISQTSVKRISQPIQKLVKRMLKRKIHPELEGRTKSCAAVPSKKRELGAHDTISLLQTPDQLSSWIVSKK